MLFRPLFRKLKAAKSLMSHILSVQRCKDAKIYNRVLESLQKIQMAQIQEHRETDGKTHTTAIKVKESIKN